MKKSFLVFGIALALTGGGIAIAQHDHGHGHEDHGKSDSKLTLNNGKKWKTDEQLRGGMTAIRDEVQAAVVPIHSGKYTPEDYKGLAERIEKQITGVIAKCKLPPEVDAQIHIVLGQILSGTDVMKQDGDRMSGVVKVIKALGDYEKFFEHPSWKPIKH